MSNRYLRAEELARLAGLAKSTVLAAIRRGDIRSSRTLGRGTRIPLESAREYLSQRGKGIPVELREARSSALAVVTDRVSLCDRLRSIVRPHWTVNANRHVYATLIWVGVHAPSWVVVDLDMALLNPFHVIRALVSLGHRAPAHIVVIASQPELLTAARSVGATNAFLSHEVDRLVTAFDEAQV